MCCVIGETAESCTQTQKMFELEGLNKSLAPNVHFNKVLTSTAYICRSESDNRRSGNGKMVYAVYECTYAHYKRYRVYYSRSTWWERVWTDTLTSHMCQSAMLSGTWHYCSCREGAVSPKNTAPCPAQSGGHSSGVCVCVCVCVTSTVCVCVCVTSTAAGITSL